MKLKISPFALTDLEESIEYYNQQQKNLGDDFADKVNSTFDRIKENPKQFTKEYKELGLFHKNKYLFDRYHPKKACPDIRTNKKAEMVFTHKKQGMPCLYTRFNLFSENSFPQKKQNNCIKKNRRDKACLVSFPHQHLNNIMLAYNYKKLCVLCVLCGKKKY